MKFWIYNHEELIRLLGNCVVCGSEHKINSFEFYYSDNDKYIIKHHEFINNTITLYYGDALIDGYSISDYIIFYSSESCYPNIIPGFQDFSKIRIKKTKML